MFLKFKPNKKKVTKLNFFNPIKLNTSKSVKKVSLKNLTWPQASLRFPRLNPFGDIDKDGKLNMFDCHPFDNKRHGKKPEDFLKKYRFRNEKQLNKSLDKMSITRMGRPVINTQESRGKYMPLTQEQKFEKAKEQWNNLEASMQLNEKYGNEEGKLNPVHTKKFYEKKHADILADMKKKVNEEGWIKHERKKQYEKAEKVNTVSEAATKKWERYREAEELKKQEPEIRIGFDDTEEILDKHRYKNEEELFAALDKDISAEKPTVHKDED